MFWLFFVCFVCFPAVLCSDNLPRCPTFLIAGSFSHSTRKWISEMWWRLMAPLIACLTSCVLPKCMNLRPPRETSAPLLMQRSEGWINVRNCLQTDMRGRIIGNVDGCVAHLLDSSRPFAIALLLTLSEHTHRLERWPDCVPRMWCPWGVVGVGADSRCWWRSADGQRLRALMGDAWCETAAASWVWLLPVVCTFVQHLTPLHLRKQFNSFRIWNKKKEAIIVD